jgi:hypothetical protein
VTRLGDFSPFGRFLLVKVPKYMGYFFHG